jgi:hypothetical protein
MSAQARAAKISLARILRPLAIWGPGLLVMLADTDAGLAAATPPPCGSVLIGAARSLASALESRRGATSFGWWGVA